jgi:hypothetical protein
VKLLRVYRGDAIRLFPLVLNAGVDADSDKGDFRNVRRASDVTMPITDAFKDRKLICMPLVWQRCSLLPRPPSRFRRTGELAIVG